MHALVTGVSAGAGLLLGGELEIVVERLGERRPFDRPWWRCPSCGTPYRGGASSRWPMPCSCGAAAASCRERVSHPWRPAVLGCVSAVVLGAFAARIGDDVVLAAYAVFGLSMVAMSAVDFERQIIPNRLIYPTLVVMVPLFVVASAVDDRWGSLARAAIGGAAAFVAFLVVHLAVPAGHGLRRRASGRRDRASPPDGSGSAMPSWASSPPSCSGRWSGSGPWSVSGAGRKTRIPFGPFLAAGAVVTVLWGSPVAHALFHQSRASAQPRRGRPDGPGARGHRSRLAGVLRFLTAGESHGKALVVIVEGLPAGLPVTAPEIAGELARRRLGYGRGPADAVRGRRDHARRRDPPRPHAGLTGGHRDRQHRMAQVAGGDVARPRVALQGADQAAPGPRRSGRACRSTGSTTPATCSSGRRRGETAARVAAGCLAKALLARLGRVGAEPRRRPRPRAGRRRGAPGARRPRARSTTPPCGASTPTSRRGWCRPSRPRPRTGTRSGAWSRSSPTASRWASAATCTGTAVSTGCWPRRS